MTTDGIERERERDDRKFNHKELVVEKIKLNI